MSTSTSTQKPTPGAANSSSWNDSGFAFAPNTNTMDPVSMPSDQAQAAREKSAQVMAALKAGDTQKANALMGKDETKGRILPGMSWIKKKLNKKDPAKLEGESIDGASSDAGSLVHHDDADVKIVKT